MTEMMMPRGWSDNSKDVGAVARAATALDEGVICDIPPLSKDG
jgi:hypothetical protein